MARSRNIKPGFFKDDELSESCPLARLLFIGLWTIADFNGCLEYRPKRIKAEILPYDECDIDDLIESLSKKLHIVIYHDSKCLNKRYIQISNFSKHQRPHPNEVKSGTDIPSPDDCAIQPIEIKGVVINHDKECIGHVDDISNPPDSLIPHPSSSQSDSLLKSVKKPRFKKPTIEEVQEYCLSRSNTVNAEQFIDHYTSNGWRVGKNSMKDWKAAVRTWEKNAYEKNGRTGQSSAKRVSDALEQIAREDIEQNGFTE